MLATVMIAVCFVSTLPALAANGNFHAVKGAVYINNIVAPVGTTIYLVFPTENLSRQTFAWDNGYNYAISFQDHEGQTGSFSVYYQGHYLVPVDNQTVTIEQNVIKYRLDLHVMTELPVNQPPYTPSAPDPSNGQSNVFINAILSWIGGDPDVGDTVTYDVYFGTTNPPAKVATGQSGTSFNPGLMSVSTQYYWKIVAFDNHAASTAGPVWSFTTIPAGTNNPPNQPATPSPADTATGIDVSTSLSWTGGDPDAGDIVIYDVYFGTTSSPAKVAGNQSAIAYTLGTLDFITKYYWKIVAWDNHGQSRAGLLWTFTTKTSDGDGGGGGGTQNIPPVADPSEGEPYRGIVGENIIFDGSKSRDSDGTIAKWYWTFGDGANGTGKIVTHVYSGAGTFTVKLTVTDDQGATDTDNTTATITTPNLPPSKPTLVGPTTGAMNTSYTYTAISTDPENSSLTYTFDWDDNTSTTATLPSGTPALANHTWISAGVYHVSVVVTDDQMASVSTSLTVLINVEYTDDIGYLIDHNGDGTYDSFYSNQTKKETSVEKQVNGTYFIDSTGDGKWDYIYDPHTKTLMPYPNKEGTPQSDMALQVLGGILGIIAVLFIILLLLVRRKKNKQTPPPAESFESEKPVIETATPKKSTTKNPQKPAK